MGAGVSTGGGATELAAGAGSGEGAAGTDEGGAGADEGGAGAGEGVGVELGAREEDGGISFWAGDGEGVLGG